MEIPALSSYESTDVHYDANIDFDQFVSKENEDGSRTDSMDFYIGVDTKNFVTVYTSEELTADAMQMELMKSLKNVGAKCAITNKEAEVEALEIFEKGDSAKLELTVDGEFAQNRKDYVNGVKVIWEEQKNDVLKLKRNGVIKAVGEGKKTVKGYIVPADNETILAEGGAASVDNYSRMPSAAIVPVQATVQVGGEKQSHATPTPTPKPTTSPTANPQISKKKVLKKGDIFSDSKSNGKYKVTKSSAGKYEISFVKYTGKSKKTVTIPNSIKKNGTRYTVTGIGAKAFYKNKKITKVIIPKNVTTIGNKAFYGCKKLKTIQIKSQKLKTIGNKALYGINKKAVIGIPKRKRKKYIKLFSKKTGFRKTMKFKNL